jgi:hypothetical protein
MRKTSPFLTLLGVIAIIGAGLGGCEDDGGAPGWNTGLTDASAVLDAAAPRDGQSVVPDAAAARDGNQDGQPAGSDAARDATGF